MSKHTPGPWDYRYNGHYFEVGVLDERSAVPIWPTVCMGVPANQEGNARLIAAAPDLYEALKSFVADWSDDTGMSSPSYESVHLARAAIAKAEGVMK